MNSWKDIRCVKKDVDKQALWLQQYVYDEIIDTMHETMYEAEDEEKLSDVIMDAIESGYKELIKDV